MSNTRYFGKCSTKGCHVRRVVDLPNYSIKFQGRLWRLNAHEYGLRGADRRAFWDAMVALDLVCVEHNKFLRWEGLRATYNPEKECSAKCINATGPSCSCSCNGENHGGGRLTWISN